MTIWNLKLECPLVPVITTIFQGSGVIKFNRSGYFGTLFCYLAFYPDSEDENLLKRGVKISLAWLVLKPVFWPQRLEEWHGNSGIRRWGASHWVCWGNSRGPPCPPVWQQLGLGVPGRCLSLSAQCSGIVTETIILSYFFFKIDCELQKLVLR